MRPLLLVPFPRPDRVAADLARAGSRICRPGMQRLTVLDYARRRAQDPPADVLANMTGDGSRAASLSSCRPSVETFPQAMSDTKSGTNKDCQQGGRDGNSKRRKTGQEADGQHLKQPKIKDLFTRGNCKPHVKNIRDSNDEDRDRGGGNGDHAMSGTGGRPCLHSSLQCQVGNTPESNKNCSSGKTA